MIKATVFKAKIMPSLICDSIDLTLKAAGFFMTSEKAQIGVINYQIFAKI
jgi:hypothetical protein